MLVRDPGQTSSASPGGDLYIVNTCASDPTCDAEPRQITHGLNAKWPKWSPDGHSILFADAPVNKAQEYDLWRLNPDTGGKVEITQSPGVRWFPLAG